MSLHCREPRLEEILADPIVKAVMEADGVDLRELVADGALSPSCCGVGVFRHVAILRAVGFRHPVQLWCFVRNAAAAHSNLSLLRGAFRPPLSALRLHYPGGVAQHSNAVPAVG